MVYNKQTFSVGQVLTAAELNQLEDNVSDHVHGLSSVAKTGISWARTAQAAGFTATGSDIGKFYECTGTFTIDFSAAATLGAGWAITVKNIGTGVITLDPSGAETINGQTTWFVGPDSEAIVYSDGTGLHTVFQSGAWEIIQTQVASTSASIDFTGFVDTRFNQYLVVFSNVVSVNASAPLSVRLSDGTFQTTNYLWHTSQLASASAAYAAASSSSVPDATKMRISTLSGSADIAIGGEFRIYDPSETASDIVCTWQDTTITTTSSISTSIGGGACTGLSAALAGIRFLMHSGNISTGNFQLLGGYRT